MENKENNTSAQEADIIEIPAWRQAQFREVYAANIQAENLPNAGVTITTPDELLWLLKEHNWSGEPARKAQRKEETDLRGISLRGINLYGVYLQRANLAGAILDNANLSRTKLGQANLEGASLRDAVLEGADLVKTNLRDADLTGAKFHSADMRLANLQNDWC